MRVLVLFAHPVETSYQAALHQCVVETLTAKGHEVDDCNLYAEGFDPLLTREERLSYHDLAANQKNVASHVERLEAAEGIVVVTPVWNFGYPAILKGYFDRVFLPGVSFEIVDGRVEGRLSHINKLMVVTTYGATKATAFLMGDPPRRIAKRVLRSVLGLSTEIHYLAHYDMNRSTEQTRKAFLDKVQSYTKRF